MAKYILDFTEKYNMSFPSWEPERMAKLDELFKAYEGIDHGRHLWNEGPGNVRPGCGLYDRALGIMYMLGVWDSLEKFDK